MEWSKMFHAGTTLCLLKRVLSNVLDFCLHQRNCRYYEMYTVSIILLYCSWYQYTGTVVPYLFFFVYTVFLF